MVAQKIKLIFCLFVCVTSKFPTKTKKQWHDHDWGQIWTHLIQTQCVSCHNLFSSPLSLSSMGPVNQNSPHPYVPWFNPSLQMQTSTNFPCSDTSEHWTSSYKPELLRWTFWVIQISGPHPNQAFQVGSEPSATDSQQPFSTAAIVVHQAKEVRVKSWSPLHTCSKTVTTFEKQRLPWKLLSLVTCVWIIWGFAH